jgi:hypothetical protein
MNVPLAMPSRTNFTTRVVSSLPSRKLKIFENETNEFKQIETYNEIMSMPIGIVKLKNTIDKSPTFNETLFLDNFTPYAKEQRTSWSITETKNLMKSALFG